MKSPKQMAKEMFENSTQQLWNTGKAISKFDVKDYCIGNINMLLESANPELHPIKPYWEKVIEEIEKL